MATCVNCIHHSLCDYNTNISGNGKVRLVYSDGADVKCSFFQNTADVVPKSEVEWLQKEVDRLSQVVLYYDAFKADEIKDVKAEVNMEIFAEIDIILSEHYGKASEKTDLKLLEPLRQAQRFVINEIYDDLAKLKKKFNIEE